MNDSTPQQYDALLVLSFGGPEGQDEVIPFLENVTRGRGIPKDRLEVVGQHYRHFGGVSPLNDCNREIIAHLEEKLDLPIYFGNRNWHPFATETAEQMAKDGVRRTLVFATSAWGGYSACRQYDEDIQNIIQYLQDKNLPGIEFTKLRHFHNHPLFIEAFAQALQDKLDLAEGGPNSRVLFTAHSIPTAADEHAGGDERPNLYSRQVFESSKLIAQKLGIESYENVWQSRSGNPRTPWLEPDVVDRVTELHEQEGVTEVVVCPVGFISDHMEVVWDLDTELQQACDEMGVRLLRADTIGHMDIFTNLVVDLINEVLKGEEPKFLGEIEPAGCTINGQLCAADCCENPMPKMVHNRAPQHMGAHPGGGHGTMPQRKQA